MSSIGLPKPDREDKRVRLESRVVEKLVKQCLTGFPGQANSLLRRTEQPSFAWLKSVCESFPVYMECYYPLEGTLCGLLHRVDKTGLLQRFEDMKSNVEEDDSCALAFDVEGDGFRELVLHNANLNIPKGSWRIQLDYGDPSRCAYIQDLESFTEALTLNFNMSEMLLV